MTAEDVVYLNHAVFGLCKVVDLGTHSQVFTPVGWEVRCELTEAERCKFVGVAVRRACTGRKSVAGVSGVKLGLSAAGLRAVGERVRALRLGAGETQYELAERAVIWQTYVSMLERGVLPLTRELLAVIAVHYGASVERLVDGLV